MHMGHLHTAATQRSHLVYQADVLIDRILTAGQLMHSILVLTYEMLLHLAYACQSNNKQVMLVPLTVHNSACTSTDRYLPSILPYYSCMCI